MEETVYQFSEELTKFIQDNNKATNGNAKTCWDPNTLDVDNCNTLHIDNEYNIGEEESSKKIIALFKESESDSKSENDLKWIKDILVKKNMCNTYDGLVEIGLRNIIPYIPNCPEKNDDQIMLSNKNKQLVLGNLEYLAYYFIYNNLFEKPFLLLSNPNWTQDMNITLVSCALTHIKDSSCEFPIRFLIPKGINDLKNPLGAVRTTFLELCILFNYMEKINKNNKPLGFTMHKVNEHTYKHIYDIILFKKKEQPVGGGRKRTSAGTKVIGISELLGGYSDKYVKEILKFKNIKKYIKTTSAKKTQPKTRERLTKITTIN